MEKQIGYSSINQNKTKKMSKEFVSYDIALAMKELGFDKKCFKSYQIVKAGLGGQEYIELMDVAYDDFIDLCHAPLYQQAFRWFREKYKLFSEVNLTTKQENVESFEFFVLNVNEPLFESDDYTVYEEAELACLRKLIEIVKHNPLYF